MANQQLRLQLPEHLRGGGVGGIDGHPSVLILLAGYILSMLAPFFIVWLWEKIKKFF